VPGHRADGHEELTGLQTAAAEFRRGARGWRECCWTEAEPFCPQRQVLGSNMRRTAPPGAEPRCGLQ